MFRDEALRQQGDAAHVLYSMFLIMPSRSVDDGVAVTFAHVSDSIASTRLEYMLLHGSCDVAFGNRPFLSITLPGDAQVAQGGWEGILLSSYHVAASR